MASGLLNVSVSGLNVAQMGLLTTSHNIANASTPGYNRQTIVQTTNTPMFTGAGFVGQGANVETVKRVYSAFLAGQVQTAATTAASLETYSQQIAQIDNLLADPSAGLSPAMQEFFSAVGAAAANPSSLAGRQAMLSAAQVMTSRFQSLDQQLTAIRDGTNEQIRAEVGTINSYVSQIAGINQQIVLAQATDGNQPANDLQDQRDQLLADLNKHIQVTSHLESDGSYSVFFGSGQPMVIGTQSYQLAALADREDLANLQVGLVLPGSPTIPIPESLVAGGTLGGLLNFRSITLDSAQNSLGRIAVALASDFNAQHALGQDLGGAVGGNFFRPITLSTLGAPANAGGAVLSANVTVSDYTVSYGATGYTITRLSDDSDLGTFSSLPQVVDGLRISLAAGTPNVGDSFLIHPDSPAGQRSTSFASNTGSAALDSTGSNIQSLAVSDYRLVLTGANAFSLERLSDHRVWTGVGASQTTALADLMAQASPLGFDLSLSGTMQAGDSFLLRPTRFAARDMGLAISDARSIALAVPIRTSSGLSNAGTATISAGAVSDTSVKLAAPFSIAYEQSSNSFTGFPVGATVVANGQTYKVTGPTMRIAYTAGSNISLNGVGIAISGVPADGDSFTINPPPTASIAAGTNAGTGAIAAGTVTSTSSLPAQNITLTFQQATAVPARPDRMTGLPVGTVVTVTPIGGRPVTYTISSISDYVPYTSGATVAFNGLSVAITGTPVHGDTFTVGPNASGVSDNRNAALLGALQSHNTMADATATYQTVYSQMVSEVGNKAREVEVKLTAQQNLVDQGATAVASLSGVNLDEEAANLLKYQQAYQASAKIIDISGRLFDQLLTLGR
ncbi:MAG: flagellar hook-associated protein FlgK [Rhodocyclaceae bacterium]|nr:flagellar hook-associated protein FlgK [Rhodocyclaceae bacterium]